MYNVSEYVLKSFLYEKYINICEYRPLPCRAEIFKAIHQK